MGRVAEWSALQTGKRGDSSSIPVKVKFFLNLELNLEIHEAKLPPVSWQIISKA